MNILRHFESLQSVFLEPFAIAGIVGLTTLYEIGSLYESSVISTVIPTAVPLITFSQQISAIQTLIKRGYSVES